MQTPPLLITNARLVDPLLGTESSGELLLADGAIQPQETPLPRDVLSIDAQGRTVTPGLIDLHVHFREPGGEAAETLATGAACAACGGFSTVVTMPNTLPPADTPAYLQRQLDATRNAPSCILPSACLTAERRGESVADLQALKAAGAIAFTDDGSFVGDESVMQAAMRAAAGLNMPVMDHAVMPEIAGNGVIRKGAVSERLNVPGMPAEAEIEAVKRDIRLAEATGCHLHVQHLSCGESVALIRAARARGVAISAETTPHHISLTVEDIPGDNANYKMNPPLGTTGDAAALIEGLRDGTIECLATDHAPHPVDKKALGLVNGPFGIIGLESAIGVSFKTLVASNRLSFMQWLQAWTTGPASILGLPPPTLQSGSDANIVIIDTENPWKLQAADLRSKSTNCPFLNIPLQGRAVITIHNGRIVYQTSS